MSTQVIRVRKKGQITLPTDVRRELGIEEGDKIVLTRENGRYAITALNAVVDPTSGALAEYARGRPPVSLDDMQRAIEEGMMEHYLHKLAGERSTEEIESAARNIAEDISEYGL